MPRLNYDENEARRESVRGQLLHMDARYAGRRMPEQQRRQWDRLSAELSELGQPTVRRGMGARASAYDHPYNDPPVPPPFGGCEFVGCESFTEPTVMFAVDPTATPVVNPVTWINGTASFTCATAVTPDRIEEMYAEYERQVMNREMQRREGWAEVIAPNPAAELEMWPAVELETLPAVERERRRQELEARYARNIDYTYPVFLNDGPEVRIELPPSDPREVTIGRTRKRARQMRARVAQRRAEGLLLKHLDGEQAAEWKAHKYFHVETADGQRTYRIRHGVIGNVSVMRDADAHPNTSRRIDGAYRCYCCHLAQDYECPVEDNVLAQKLYLQCWEEEFLRLANPF